MHCATPTISDTKHTILQATDTLTALGKNVPSSTSEFIAQSKTIQKLNEIIMSIHLPPVRHHQGCSAHDCLLSQNQRLQCKTHHQVWCASVHTILPHHLLTIQPELLPLQRMSPCLPMLVCCNPSTTDKQKHIGNWKTTPRMTKTKTLLMSSQSKPATNTAMPPSVHSSDKCLSIQDAPYTIHFLLALLQTPCGAGGGQKCYGFWRGHFDPVPSLPTLLHLIFLDWLFRTDFIIFGRNAFLPAMMMKFVCLRLLGNHGIFLYYLTFSSSIQFEPIDDPWLSCVTYSICM